METRGLSEVAALLDSAHSVAVLTGAGVSAESGVPTFREAQTGLWAQYDPEELATAGAFAAHPQLVWDWYQWRRNLVAHAAPNPGHLALVQLEAYLALRDLNFTLITQNVDALHQRAGSQNIIELHGNITRSKCFVCHRPAPDIDPEGETHPHCQHCSGLLRPDVVWFGEGLPAGALEQAWSVAEASAVFLSIGTSALVQPAASLPMVARQNGAVLVEINPNETPLSPHCNFVLQGSAGIVLPALMAHLNSSAKV